MGLPTIIFIFIFILIFTSPVCARELVGVWKDFFSDKNF